MKQHIFVAIICLTIELSSCCSVFAQTVTAGAELPLSQSSQLKTADREMKPLISVAALAQKMEAGDEICLIEIGNKRKRYDKGHIKGAHFLHWTKDIIDPKRYNRYNVLEQASLEALMSKLGVANDSHIVVYDRFSSRLSTRMCWTLKFWGHDNVQVLDGGFAKWSSSRQPVTDVVPKVEVTNYQVKTTRHELRVDAQRVEELLSSSSGTLIDGRPVKQFTGEESGTVFHTGKQHQNKGHIPGAINIPWKDNFKKDGTFKSVLELKEMYHQSGMDSDGPIVTYCNEGLHAALPWFVASALLDCENVSIYDDSMAEWANSDRPIQLSVPNKPKE